MSVRWFQLTRPNVVASLKVTLPLALSCTTLLLACEKLWPGGPRPDVSSKPTAAETATAVPASAEPTSPSPPSSAQEPVTTNNSADAGNAPYPGPWLTVVVASAPVYPQPSSDKDSKLGYVQSGTRLAVTEGKPKPSESCASGWLELVEGGYVCSAIGTLDEKDSRAHFTLRTPDLDALLPYTYARNAKNGTPMYRTVPTREEMQRYEPYLNEVASELSSSSKRHDQTTSSATSNAVGAASASPSGSALPLPVSSVTSPPAPSGSNDDVDKPWWQRESVQDKLHEMKLSDLRSDSDEVLAQRMVKGFYVAVDRTFRWNGRTWYKTTKHMVVPADRFGVAGPSDFRGVELGSDWQLPVAWVHGGLETITTYDIDPQKKQPKPAGKLKHFESVQLTTDTLEVNSVTYLGLKNGKWVRQSQIRVTAPGPAPEELKQDERWLDVNLTQQTLVAFEGSRPVFATLLSSGKSSKIKDKDHSTPLGHWRIREKHVTTTMDGDGTAAGDLPYSIEDVPYVMYFYRSYAVHGAFWHRNYGIQMSHGCINLSPLDSKRLFFFTAPHIPTGWHGVWSSSSRPGSWVVVHE
jgi:hypothetical protein